jgi:hypothetical protein|tara:strand:+ start:7685 stop:8047 length:363 start_codon:yes stop_codon:yes gene_type:complete
MKDTNNCPVCGEEGKYFPVSSMPYISDGNSYYCGRFSYIFGRLKTTQSNITTARDTEIYLVRTQFCDTWFPSVAQEEAWNKQLDEWYSKNRVPLPSQDEIYSDINILNIDSGGFPISYEE